MTRILDPTADLSPVAPDLVLIDGAGLGRDRADFALAGPNDARNPLGLRSGQTLATGIALCMMTDARGTPDPLDRGEVDLRGWPGDGFDVDTARGEAPLGNTVWERFRWPADSENATEIAARLTAALEPLRRQQVLGTIECIGEADPATNRISVRVRLTAPDGRVIYEGPYAGLWEALLAVVDPLAP